jgi:hypothetical protein
MFHVVATLSLALIGTAHANKVSGGTGTGNKYTVSLAKSGPGTLAEGNLVQRAKVQVTYRDAEKYFNGAPTAVAYLRMNLPNVKAGQSVEVALKRNSKGTYQGTVSTQIIQRSGFNGPIVPGSTVTFGSGKIWDSQFNHGYPGPTMPE